jgi:hypothetical protein
VPLPCKLWNDLIPLERFDPKLKRGEPTQLACFNFNRPRIEKAASAKFDMRYIEDDGTVMVKAEDL